MHLMMGRFLELAQMDPDDFDHSCLLKTLVKVLGAVAVVYVGNSFWKGYSKEKRLSRLINENTKRNKEIKENIKRALDSVHGQMEQEWEHIVTLDFDSLLSQLQSGNLKAVDVLHAYQTKALQVDRELNCVTSFLLEAESLAQACDALPTAQRGPLHGLPVSVKECFMIASHYSTAGMSQFLDQPAKEDNPAVKQLCAMGAIPFCQTNVPQSLCSLQCSNPVFGATGNPYDAPRDPGGSSGGEGSLIGAGGSILGLGSDVGGSLRNPAAMCGIASLKPTYGRHLSQLLCRDSSPYCLIGLNVVGGFLSSHVSGLVTAWKNAWDQKMQQDDPFVALLPWREDRFEPKRKLRIGYYLTDGYYDPHPGFARVIKEAAELLRQNGHTLFEFPPPPTKEISMVYGAFFLSGDACSADALYDDIRVDSAVAGFHRTAWIFTLPKFLRYLILSLSKLLTNDPVPDPCETSMEVIRHLTKSKEMYLEYTAKMKKHDVDVILTPGALYPSPLMGYNGELVHGTFPYETWNLFNMPAGILPMSKVSKEDDKAFNEMPKNDYVKCLIHKAVAGAIGLPLAVQIVGRRFDEEMILHVMTELEMLSKRNKY